MMKKRNDGVVVIPGKRGGRGRTGIGEGKLRLIERNMTGGNDTPYRRVKAAIAFFRRRIAQEDTGNGTWG